MSLCCNLPASASTPHTRPTAKAGDLLLEAVRAISALSLAATEASGQRCQCTHATENTDLRDEFESESESRLVMPDSLRPRGL